jgi:hypothetical protein
MPRGHGFTSRELSDAGRKGKVSAARRDLIRVAVVERGIRPVDVSRLLGISTASVAEHLAAIRRNEKTNDPMNLGTSRIPALGLNSNFRD